MILAVQGYCIGKVFVEVVKCEFPSAIDVYEKARTMNIIAFRKWFEKHFKEVKK